MVNYSFYTNVYYGNLIEDDKQFNRLKGKAEHLIDKYTFGRAKNSTNEHVLSKIKFTVCKLIDNYVKEEGMSDLKSESLDDWSVTYKDNEKYFESNPKKIITDNLILTGLLSMGV